MALGYQSLSHLTERQAMSEQRRPARRLAAALNLPNLALFVNLRSLVLPEDGGTIATLETMTGVSQMEAVDYFLQFHDWGSPEINAVLASPENGEMKREALKNELRESLSKPLIPPMPES